jgi:hypothetical protein
VLDQSGQQAFFTASDDGSGASLAPFKEAILSSQVEFPLDRVATVTGNAFVFERLADISAEDIQPFSSFRRVLSIRFRLTVGKRCHSKK